MPLYKHVPYGFLKPNEPNNNTPSNNDLSISLLPNDETSEYGKIGADGHDANIPPINLDDPLYGLKNPQVKASRAIFGRNEIIVEETPLWKLFVRQFVGVLPILITTAAIASAILLQDIISAFGFVAMLIIYTFIKFHQEYTSIDELSSSSQFESNVTTRRDGKTIQLNVKELVPGDIVLLSSGTVVPADIQWIKGDVLQVNTAALTGDSTPCKYPGTRSGDIIPSGTTIVDGNGYGRVICTGSNTEIGIAQQAKR